jgi:hypothetical protein
VYVYVYLTARFQIPMITIINYVFIENDRLDFGSTKYTRHDGKQRVREEAQTQKDRRMQKKNDWSEGVNT